MTAWAIIFAACIYARGMGVREAIHIGSAALAIVVAYTVGDLLIFLP